MKGRGGLGKKRTFRHETDEKRVGTRFREYAVKPMPELKNRPKHLVQVEVSNRSNHEITNNKENREISRWPGDLPHIETAVCVERKRGETTERELACVRMAPYVEQ